ncbi:MAG: hypothetical protein ACI9R3_005027 [Verrucomicrobiales bacterium]|jgi:hypothetical protein
MTNKTRHFLTISSAAVAAISLSSCEVKQTEEGALPDVDVDVKGGNLPKYDVDAGDIDVGTKTKTIEVEVPTVDFDSPAEDEVEDGE